MGRCGRLGKSYYATCFMGPNGSNFITGLLTGKYNSTFEREKQMLNDLASSLLTIHNSKEEIDSTKKTENRLVFVIDNGDNEDNTNVTLRDLRKREYSSIVTESTNQFIKPYRPRTYSILHPSPNTYNSFFSRGRCPW